MYDTQMALWPKSLSSLGKLDYLLLYYKLWRGTYTLAIYNFLILHSLTTHFNGVFEEYKVQFSLFYTQTLFLIFQIYGNKLTTKDLRNYICLFLTAHLTITVVVGVWICTVIDVHKVLPNSGDPTDPLTVTLLFQILSL